MIVVACVLSCACAGLCFDCCVCDVSCCIFEIDCSLCAFALICHLRWLFVLCGCFWSGVVRVVLDWGFAFVCVNV